MTPEQELEEERLAAVEHRDVITALADLLENKSGQILIKYLFKNFQVGELPPFGLEGLELHDQLGFLRAGNAVYKIACEANFNKAGEILAKIEKEKYEKLYQLNDADNFNE